MMPALSLISLLWFGQMAAAFLEKDPDKPSELAVLSVPEYGVEVQAPSHWRLVAKAQDSLVLGLSIPNEDALQAAGAKCEIGPAPESLDEYRWRIDRRAAREQVPGLSLATNQVVKGEDGERLVTLWNYETKDRGTVHDLELRLISHEQLYTFTLRAPDPTFDSVREPFEKLVATTRFSPPDTGLELTEDGYCVQNKFRFGLKLPKDWKPSFPLSNESLFWATSKPKGIWNDNLLVIASKAAPLDLEALAEALPGKLREEDPQCTVKSCKRVTQGKLGDALETVVETSRGPFHITVLERRYTGRRYNYEIKFTVTSETFEQSADALRKSADSFVEFVAPQDLKGGAT